MAREIEFFKLKFVIQGVKVHNLTCGYGHTLFIAKNDLDEEKKNLLKMNVFTGTA